MPQNVGIFTAASTRMEASPLPGETKLLDFERQPVFTLRFCKGLKNHLDSWGLGFRSNKFLEEYEGIGTVVGSNTANQLMDYSNYLGDFTHPRCCKIFATKGYKRHVATNSKKPHFAMPSFRTVGR